MGAPFSMNVGGNQLKITSTTRYILLVVVLIIGLHSILSLTHESYSSATSLSRITAHLAPGSPATPAASTPTSKTDEEQADIDARYPPRQNATLLMLARNSDINGVVQSVRELEDRWNRHRNYPWLFLNEEPFTDEFKKRVSVLTNAQVTFGVIPPEHWFQPDWIDEEKATAGRDDLVANNVIYGGSVPYRNMCRFNSGFFYRHELLQKYRWYWRVEPDVHFFCDVNHDPFTYMIENNKTYGWTISMYEFQRTIPTLWGHVKDFMKEHPEHIAENNAMRFLSDNGGRTYNLCHFWSNFEIADLDFWRGDAYREFFEYLDATGGFYYERWGDAPVHSIAAALFLGKDKLHFFNEIGYFHTPFTHCPRGDAPWREGRCSCNQAQNFDYNPWSSCMNRWDKLWK